AVAAEPSDEASAAEPSNEASAAESAAVPESGPPARNEPIRGDLGHSKAIIAATAEARQAAQPPPAPTATRTSARATPSATCRTGDGLLVYDTLVDRARELQDTVTVADVPSRIALPPQVAALQRLRRSLQARSWPSCGERAALLLTEATD